MASVVDRQSVGANGASPSFTTSVQTGDVIAIISCNDFYTAANVSAPTATGYTFTQRGSTLDGGTNSIHMKVFTATAPSTNAALSIALNSHPNDEEFLFFMYVLRGYNEAPDVAPTGAVQATPALTWVAPAVTTTAASDLLICVWAGNNNGSAVASITLPGSMTANTFRAVSSFWGGNSGDEVVTAIGSTGTRTATPNTTLNYTSLSVAFSQATGGGGLSSLLNPAPMNRARLIRASTR